MKCTQQYTVDYSSGSNVEKGEDHRPIEKGSFLTPAVVLITMYVRYTITLNSLDGRSMGSFTFVKYTMTLIVSTPRPIPDR